jgi:hypothetical protein
VNINHAAPEIITPCELEASVTPDIIVSYQSVEKLRFRLFKKASDARCVYIVIVTVKTWS